MRSNNNKWMKRETNKIRRKSNLRIVPPRRKTKGVDRWWRWTFESIKIIGWWIFPLSLSPLSNSFAIKKISKPPKVFGSFSTILNLSSGSSIRTSSKKLSRLPKINYSTCWSRSPNCSPTNTPKPSIPPISLLAFMMVCGVQSVRMSGMRVSTSKWLRQSIIGRSSLRKCVRVTSSSVII